MMQNVSVTGYLLRIFGTRSMIYPKVAYDIYM